MFFSALGIINPPNTTIGGNPGDVLQGLISVASSTLIAGAGIYALFNFILAGYAFMSADGDPGKVQGAWAKIYQTMIGLAFAGGAFVLAAIAGQLLFQRWDALTSPIIPTL